MRHPRPLQLTCPALVLACRSPTPFPAACTCASGWPWSAAWRCSRSAWAGPGALHRSKKPRPPCPPRRPRARWCCATLPATRCCAACSRAPRWRPASSPMAPNCASSPTPANGSRCKWPRTHPLAGSPPTPATPMPLSGPGRRLASCGCWTSSPPERPGAVPPSAARVEALVQSHKSLRANASHELLSPLTRIRMGLELMSGDQPSPAFREEILHNIAELDQLVDEILLASRLDAREADVGTVELVDLIGLAAEECARVDADLAVNSSSDALQVLGVAKLLRRALRNLLENAQRHSTGNITVLLQRCQGYAEVQVCDRGPGVPPNQRERIFEPFYRLPGASERAGGVGLGLSLVRSIAGRHNGSVHCKDHAGGGACFVLHLPPHQE